MKDHEYKEILLNWSQEVVEQPTPAFGNLPVCPFAKKARLEDKIKLEVSDFTSESIAELVKQFNPDTYDILIIIFRDKPPIDQFFDLVYSVKAVARSDELELLGAHPDDDWEIADHRTQWPFAACLISRIELLSRLRNKLFYTRYYDQWSKENLEEFGISLPTWKSPASHEQSP